VVEHVERILAADEQAAQWFKGRTWMAEALRTMGVEVVVVELPDDIRASVRTAQVRQYR
jgi:hypothetical protein